MLYLCPQVVLDNNIKVQNNVSVYTGVTCDDVFLDSSLIFIDVLDSLNGTDRREAFARTAKENYEN